MVELDGTEKDIEVEEGQTILDACLENGIETSYDCNMGVCMTCPAKMLAGEVDQAAGMLSEDTQAKGYALLCVATPTSDCKVQIIPEDELLNEQLGE
ncbi:unnamed protein product [Pedinophyceae sp. YPF-701]|nr:unnamed protein product [Pedinophyceae sp. YPF-701]